MITQPYPSFIDPKVGGRAKPVSNGTIFIGEDKKDQIQFPEKVYYTDSKGTEIEIAQPIYLNSAGVTVDSKNSSTVIRPYTKSASYSILIKNSNDNPVYISDSVSESLSKESVGEYTDIVYKSDVDNSAVENMIAGKPISAKVGDVCNCEYGTSFVRISNSSGDLSDFVLTGEAVVDDFGATSSNPDCTKAYNFIIKNLPNQSKIKWRSDCTYTGNFVADGKEFHLDINHAELVNFSDKTYILAMINSVETEYAVTDSELFRLDLGFTVAGASGLFKAGDIGYLWDSATRPADSGKVNFECVKISEISGDFIKVEGKIRSYKGAGAIKFYHFNTQLKDCSMKNVRISCGPTFEFNSAAIIGFDKVRHSDIEVNGSYFDSMTVRKSYDVIGKDTRPLNPRETSLGGTGYGLNYRIVTNYEVESVKGVGCRHAYDQDNAYRGVISIVEDPNDKSSCCALAHSGFTSDLEVSKVCASGELYPVSTSDQGYGVLAGQALKENHPLVNVTIRNVRGEVPSTKDVNAFNVAGVYLRQNTDNVHISDVAWKYIDSTEVSGGGSSGVRIDGIPIGNTSIEKLNGNKIGQAIAVGASEGSVSNEILVIDDIYVNEVFKTARIEGRINFNIDNICHDKVVSTTLVEALDGASGNINDYSIFIGQAIRYKGSDKIIYTNLDDLRAKGSIAKQARTSSTAVSVDSGSTLTLGELQNKSMLIRLAAPDSESYTMSANFLPNPRIDGQEITINALVGNITIPSGGTLDQSVTIKQGETARFVSITSLWRAA